MNDAVEAPGCMRLIGASLWSPAGSAVEHLLNLRSKLARANHAQGLRCALMYTSGWLVRWFEGPAKAVENAWTIVQDEGARGTRVLHRSIGE
ncbi:MAG TPA: BLUF domain-containing protein, partial [Ramlibacter sp.]|nr:BLUF domain-containing protein [Ramlibacter sp.]